MPTRTDLPQKDEQTDKEEYEEEGEDEPQLRMSAGDMPFWLRLLDQHLAVLRRISMSGQRLKPAAGTRLLAPACFKQVVPFPLFAPRQVRPVVRLSLPPPRFGFLG